MTAYNRSDLKTQIENMQNRDGGDRISASDLKSILVDMTDTFLTNQDDTGWASYSDTQYTSGSPLAVTGGVLTKLPNNALSAIDSQKPTDVPDFYVPNSILYDGGSSLFVAGETITGGTSGATAEIVVVQGDSTSGTLMLKSVSGVFVDNEAITSASGSALANGALLGGKILGRNGDGLGMTIFLYAVPSVLNQSFEGYIDITGGAGTPANLSKLYPNTFPFPRGAGVDRGVAFDVTSAYTLGTWNQNGGDFYIQSDDDFDVYGIIFNFVRTHKAK